MILRQQVTREQAREISEHRRELARRVSELTADLESQRQTVASLGVVLRASNIETRASREQKRLNAIRDHLFAAERDLAAWDEANPGQERMDLFQIEEREKNTCQRQ
jgi:DNA repair exonuclease SbcCD ATPase subunit